MTAILLAALVAQLQVTQADVPVIVDAVLEAIVPAEGTVGGPHGPMRIGDRFSSTLNDRHARCNA